MEFLFKFSLVINPTQRTRGVLLLSGDWQAFEINALVVYIGAIKVSISLTNDDLSHGYVTTYRLFPNRPRAPIRGLFGVIFVGDEAELLSNFQYTRQGKAEEFFDASAEWFFGYPAKR